MTITAKDMMSPQPKTIDAAATVHEAERAMHAHKVRHLVVMHEARPVGVLSERDIGFAAGILRAAPGEIGPAISTLAALDPFSVSVDTPAREVAQTMGARGIGSAIVLENDELVGIITTVDICRTLAQLCGAT